MAAYYVYSGAAGTGDGSSWANAYTSCSAAIARPLAAGDTLYVASDHVGSYAVSTSLNFPGSVSAPIKLISVSRAGSTPPVEADYTAGAIEKTTGLNSLKVYGYFESDGVTFDGADGATNNSSLSVGVDLQSYITIRNGSLKNPTSGQGGVNIGPNSTFPSIIRLINTNIVAGSHANWRVALGQSRFEWLGGTYDCSSGGASVNGFLLGSRCTYARMVGVDLSGLAGDIIGNTSNAHAQIILEKCKLKASASILTSPSGPTNADVILLHCDSGTGYQRTERYNYMGTMTAETTIVLGSGETIGATNTSMKIVSTANASVSQPFESLPFEYYNSATGASKTFTFEIVTDGVTLKDTELFVRAAYHGSSSTPLATVTETRKNILATGSNLTTSTPSPDWTTTGLTSPVKQKISITFTPQMEGGIEFTFGLAKPSTTVYINRIPAVS